MRKIVKGNLLHIATAIVATIIIFGTAAIICNSLAKDIAAVLECKG